MLKSAGILLVRKRDFEWEFVIVWYGYTWLETMTP